MLFTYVDGNVRVKFAYLRLSASLRPPIFRNYFSEYFMLQCVPLWLLCSSRVYSVRPLQLAGHFDVLDGSNGSCGQGNGGWTNQVNFWAIFFQMENLMGNWCKILAKLC